MPHPAQNVYEPQDRPQEGRNQKEERIQPWSLRNRYLRHNKFKKKKKRKKNKKRNTVQMKKQPRNTQVQINEQEVGKLPEKEFRIMTVKMIQNLKSRIEKIQESINKDLEEIKNQHTETNDTINWN